MPGRVVAQRIFVRGFVLPVRIGIFEHERQAPQKVRFDVEVDVEHRSGEPAGIEDLMSYDLITEGIRGIAAAGHIDLVETFAERIGSLVLREPGARRVTVRVEKLEIIDGGVGAEIVMDRGEALP